MMLARSTVLAVAVLLPVLANAQKTIVDTALSTGKHTVLAEALTKANLISTLNDTSKNFTVFAPTDAAFTAALKFMKATKAQLLATPGLKGILTYHVVGGVVKSTDLTNGMKATTVNGATVTVTINGKTVKINTATVTTADVMCSNGVIHVIDMVLTPPSLAPKSMTIVETAVAAGTFGVLAEALTTAKLVDTLNGKGPFTVFAPTDAAFTAALTALKKTKAELLAMKDLPGILTYHVVSGKVMSTDLTNGMKATTRNGANVTVSITGKTVKVNEATVTRADIACSNGVIHVIDAVLLPPAAPAPAPAAPAPAPAPSTVTTATTVGASSVDAANPAQVFWALVAAISAFALA